jgi:hypothetical protein
MAGLHFVSQKPVLLWRRILLSCNKRILLRSQYEQGYEKDDSQQKTCVIEFGTESVFAEQLPKIVTADDQFTFGKKSYSFYKHWRIPGRGWVKTL